MWDIRDLGKICIIKKNKKGNLKMENSKLFPCYSIPLRDFLTSHGVRYELVGLHPKTHKMFWVYIKNKELSVLTSEWLKK